MRLPPFFPLTLLSTATHINRFLADSAVPVEDDFPDSPSPADILGARMVGRWKSGAPLRITPLVDDPVLAEDPLRNNKFKFNPDSQEICPYAAHIRTSFLLARPSSPNTKERKKGMRVLVLTHEPGKMNPRKDLLKFGPPTQFVDPHLILRRGIPFGPELTSEEKLTRRTKHERGLLFVSYQSDLSQGFSFLQKGALPTPPSLLLFFSLHAQSLIEI